MRELPRAALEEGSMVVGGGVGVIPSTGRRYDWPLTSILCVLQV